MYIPLPLLILLLLIVVAALALAYTFNTKMQDAYLDRERMDARLSRKMNQINSGKYIHFPSHLLSPRIRTVLSLMSPHTIARGKESVINDINKNVHGKIHKHKKSTYLMMLVNDIIGQYVDTLYAKYGDNSEKWLADIVHFHFNFTDQRYHDFHLSDKEKHHLSIMTTNFKDMETAELSIASSVNSIY
jgi:hypothetical protein